MARPRSRNPHTPKSVALPATMWVKIDQRLGPMGSRSAWIATAVRQRLDGDGGATVAEASDMMLLTALFNRGVLTKDLWTSLKDQL